MHTNTDTHTPIHTLFYMAHTSYLSYPRTHTQTHLQGSITTTHSNLSRQVFHSLSHTPKPTHTHTHTHTCLSLFYLTHTYTLFPVFRVLQWIKIDKCRRRLTDHSAHTSPSPSSRKSPLPPLSHFGAHLPFSSSGMAGDFLWWAVTHFKPLR
jgi:hypothetical protein